MTNTGFSRRNMMVLTGAGVALAACKQEGAAGPARTEGDVNLAAMVPWGKYPIHGVEPNAANLPNNSMPDIFPAFAPKYITIVRISARKAWGLTVNHASFKVTGTTRTDREKLATDIIADISKGGGQRKRLGAADPAKFTHHVRLGGNHKGSNELVSFTEFGANQQTEIFIWLDSDSSNSGSKAGDIQTDGKYLISFSPMTSAGAPALPNDSFLARQVTLPNVSDPVIGIENYFCSFDNVTKKFVVDNPGISPKLFSMNIHFTVADDDDKLDQYSDKRIPIVIDPDTGNGVGFEP